MTTSRWCQMAVVTTLAVGATLGMTAGTAQAAPKDRCGMLVANVNHDWQMVYVFQSLAGGAADDGDWAEYEYDMSWAADYARLAEGDTALAERGGCL